MRRAQKEENVATLQGELGRATVAVLADYRGLTAGDMNRLRRAVSQADGHCRVAKNTLAKRAVAGSPYEPLGPMLRGPLALLMGFSDPVSVVKVAVRFADELPKLEIMGALVGGQVMPPAEVKVLATLPSREVVLAQLLGLLQAPATQLLRTLNEPAASLVRLLDAVGKRAGGGAEAAASQ